LKILIIAYPSLKKDPRPYRQIKNLYKKHELHCVGDSESGLEFSFYKLGKYKFYIEIFRIFLLKFGLYEFYYWDKFKKKILNSLKNQDFDLVVAHEIRLVPLALKIAKNAPVILDAHEYSPKNFDDSWLWRFFIKKYYTKLCVDNLPKVDKVLTVSPGIVDAYVKNFNTQTVLIKNACDYAANLIPSKLDPDLIKIIHHGNVSSSRKLELLIEMMKYLDNKKFQLNLMLVSGASTNLYLKKLKYQAKNLNIVFLNPVKREEIVPFCNQFDIGVIFLPPTNFNLKYCLANKFFEMIQSRLAMAIGPDIEMSKYVKKYEIGMIAKDWSAFSLANMIRSTPLSKLIYYKDQSNKYAKDLSSINDNLNFIELINSYKNAQKI
tara:strand:- start:3997 stop:5130 length:1134 start_codon:yes stop_codon:yes gene_type:complete